MSNEPKIKETTSEVEYAFGEVPASARKKLGTILVILTGIAGAFVSAVSAT